MDSATITLLFGDGPKEAQSIINLLVGKYNDKLVVIPEETVAVYMQVLASIRLSSALRVFFWQQLFKNGIAAGKNDVRTELLAEAYLQFGDTLGVVQTVCPHESVQEAVLFVLLTQCPASLGERPVIDTGAAWFHVNDELEDTRFAEQQALLLAVLTQAPIEQSFPYIDPSDITVSMLLNIAFLMMNEVAPKTIASRIHLSQASILQEIGTVFDEVADADAANFLSRIRRTFSTEPQFKWIMDQLTVINSIITEGLIDTAAIYVSIIPCNITPETRQHINSLLDSDSSYKMRAVITKWLGQPTAKRARDEEEEEEDDDYDEDEESSEEGETSDSAEGSEESFTI